MAFCTAEGYGKYTKGGRGGDVYLVTNLNDSGPATFVGEVSHQITNPWSRNKAADYGKWYVAVNIVVGNNSVSFDNWNGGVQPQGGMSFLAGLKLDQPWPSMEINQQTAEDAYELVFQKAGTTSPKRDAVEVRIIDEVRNGYATYEGAAYKKRYHMADKSIKGGIIDSQNEVGGWPELKSKRAPKDSDGDGMPDKWEKKKGLDPKDLSDRNLVGADGYTMLEKCFNNIKN